MADKHNFCLPHLHSRWNIAITYGTEMAWVLNSVLTEYVHERDRQTDRQTLHDGIGRAYAQQCATKTEQYACN